MSGYTAMAMAIGGAAIQGIGAARQADAANQNAHRANIAARNNAIAEQQRNQYQAEVERNNAVIAEQNAASIRAAATEAAQRHSVRVKNTVGAAKTDFAANGFLVDDDWDTTIWDLTTDLEVDGAHDIATMYHNAELEERRAHLQGRDFIAQAGLFDWKASQGDTGVGYNIGGVDPALAGAASFAAGASKAWSLRA